MRWTQSSSRQLLLTALPALHLPFGKGKSERRGCYMSVSICNLRVRWRQTFNRKLGRWICLLILRRVSKHCRSEQTKIKSREGPVAVARWPFDKRSNIFKFLQFTLTSAWNEMIDWWSHMREGKTHCWLLVLVENLKPHPPRPLIIWACQTSKAAPHKTAQWNYSLGSRKCRVRIP